MGLFRNGECRSQTRLEGRTAVITGANTGIGYETAKDLLARGARVVLACRTPSKAEAAAQRMRQAVPQGQIRVVKLDLASLRSVQSCARGLLDTEPDIHLLINNAGLICPYAVTEDGLEMQFQANHLGHFLFTLLLLDRIKNSAPARIINVASRFHRGGRIDFDDLHMTKSYSEVKAYARSKLCNILFTLELQSRLAGSGVVTYSVHPGAVHTEIGTELKAGCSRAVATTSLCKKTPLQGAQTTLHCALDEKLTHQRGLYYSDCKETTASKQARDPQAASRLWAVSRDLVRHYLPESTE